MTMAVRRTGSEPSAARTRGTLVHVQSLRGIAAMMVVLHHAVSARPGVFSPLDGTDFGRPGVLIFFVISGFIMLHACRDESPGQFARRRIVRVVPLYWGMTLVYFANVFRNDLAAGDPFRRVPEFVQSLLFLPHYHAGGSGDIWPILVPGWTLNYEMFFFLVFALGIALARPGRVASALLAALVLLGLMLDTTDPRLLTWTNPFLALFIAGMGLAALRQRMDISPLLPALPLGFALAVFGAVGALPAAWTHPAFFTAAVLVVAGTLALQDRAPDLTFRPLAALGDASYSIYLSHTILMIVLNKVLALLPLTGWLQFAVLTPLTLVLCALVGIAIYAWFERPAIRFLRQRFDRRT